MVLKFYHDILCLHDTEIKSCLWKTFGKVWFILLNCSQKLHLLKLSDLLTRSLKKDSKIINPDNTESFGQFQALLIGIYHDNDKSKFLSQ